MILLIFVRKGCCICDALKEKLAKINFFNISDDLHLVEIDIDRFDLYQNKYKKYDYEVPVLALKHINSEEIIELPRVSPRLKELQLRNCLQKNIKNELSRIISK